VGPDTAQGRGKCTRRFVRNARKNAKFLLSPGKTGRYTARIVSPSARTKAADSGFLPGGIKIEKRGINLFTNSRFVLLWYCQLEARGASLPLRQSLPGRETWK
jgi:hypothetical protein